VEASRARTLLIALACAVGVAAALPATAGASSQSLCIAHHPQDFVWYTSSCTGHDEPEIDPLSNTPGIQTASSSPFQHRLAKARASSLSVFARALLIPCHPG